MTDEAEPAQKKPWKFHAWLEALHAHGQKATKPKCLHGQPWDECEECYGSR